MKENTKGFTLVELLAVIVILAIVALVTTPAILNVINDSRRSGAEDKTWGTIDSVRLAFVQSQSLDNKNIIENPTVIFSSDGSDDSSTKVGRQITLNGEKPTGGKVYINTATGVITATGLKYTKGGKFVCNTNTEGTDVCCKSGDNAPSDVSTEDKMKASCGRTDFKGTLKTESS